MKQCGRSVYCGSLPFRIQPDGFLPRSSRAFESVPVNQPNQSELNLCSSLSGGELEIEAGKGRDQICRLTIPRCLWRGLAKSG
jgi:hypothetical protein